jgi:S1-C subfamily serine protease
MHTYRAACISLTVLSGAVFLLAGRAADVDRRVLDAEAKRVAAVAKVRPAVVAIFGPGGQGGGSGVCISKDGFTLTNFHVVEGAGPVMQCGLPDGVMYDAVLVGIDKVGDVALVKLVPKKEGQEFPFAPLGDSDQVQAGDWSLAMGNPFLLATDFQPTVTFGLISGVHRYQHPSGLLLEYTDCIQIDTSINPGNSGGPLFNMNGELIGINGRGSFEKRGRVNSGVGYAISINQIKNFLGHLRAGLDTDHATLGAFVRTEVDEDQEGGTARVLVATIIEDCDARRRGLDVEDEVVSFAGRPITNVNQYKNVLGLFPKGWRVPLVYRRNNEKHEILVRLMQLQPAPTDDANVPKPRPRPGPPRPRTPPRKSAATALYEPKAGFANYRFNKLERDRLLADFRKHGDFTTVAGDWGFEATGGKSDVKVAIREELPDKGPDGKPIVRAGTYHLKPETLPELPKVDDPKSEAPFRQAVRQAAGLLLKHARSFPQEFWDSGTGPEANESIKEVQRDVVIIRARLESALDDLKGMAGDRAKETASMWKAQYDYTLARLTAFIAYVDEYNYMLAQLRKDPPKRDPKIHRGWKMVPQERLASGSETRKLAAEANKLWEKMAQDYKGTKWQERAEQGRATLLGLKWEPTGGTRTVVRLNLGSVKFDLDPLKLDQDIANLQEPKGSGGLLTALYQYRRLLTLGVTGFEGHCDHAGYEPFYPPPADGSKPKSLADLRVDCEVLYTEHAAIPTKWYFSRKDQTLLGFEVKVQEDDDPCEVYLYDYKPVDGRMLPFRMEVRHGNSSFVTLNIKQYQLAAAK